MKHCPCCGETKPLEEFYRRRSSADGCQPYCKPCNRAQSKSWNSANRERRNEINLAGYHRRKGVAARAKWAAIAAEAAASC